MGVSTSIDVALPVAELLVGEAVKLLGQGTGGLGQDAHGVGQQGQLAGPRDHDLPAGPDEVAPLHLLPQLELGGAEPVLLDPDLQLAPAVQDLDEGRAPEGAQGHNPAGHPEELVGQGSGIAARDLRRGRRRSISRRHRSSRSTARDLRRGRGRSIPRRRRRRRRGGGQGRLEALAELAGRVGGREPVGVGVAARRAQLGDLALALRDQLGFVGHGVYTSSGWGLAGLVAPAAIAE
jgi:hypothetical protein